MGQPALPLREEESQPSSTRHSQVTLDLLEFELIFLRRVVGLLIQAQHICAADQRDQRDAASKARLTELSRCDRGSAGWRSPRNGAKQQLAAGGKHESVCALRRGLVCNSRQKRTALGHDGGEKTFCRSPAHRLRSTIVENCSGVGMRIRVRTHSVPKAGSDQENSVVSSCKTAA
jgi:hypothetical protein